MFAFRLLRRTIDDLVNDKREKNTCMHILKKIEPFRRDIISITTIFCSVLRVSKEKSQAIITFVHILTCFSPCNHKYLLIAVIHPSFEIIPSQLRSIIISQTHKHYNNRKIEFLVFLLN